MKERIIEWMRRIYNFINQGDENTKEALQIYLFIMGIMTLFIFLFFGLPSWIK
jgi:hypothetical protein